MDIVADEPSGKPLVTKTVHALRGSIASYSDRQFIKTRDSISTWLTPSSMASRRHARTTTCLIYLQIAVKLSIQQTKKCRQ